MEEKRGSMGGALAWMLALSTLLVWLPILGPFVAGYMGGRKARAGARVLFPALVPAALWWGLLEWVARHGITVKGDTVTFTQLSLLAWATAGALLSGALLGAQGRPARAAGVLLLAVTLVWFLPKARAVWEDVNRLRSLADTGPRYEPEKNKTCPENLKQLYNAAMLYAESWDNTLPPADRWMTAIKDNVPKDEWLHCPEVSHGQGEKFGYAMNAALGGKKLDAIADKDKTPLFYDSSDLKMDAHDEVTSLPDPGRHTGRDNVVTVSGRVEAVAPK